MKLIGALIMAAAIAIILASCGTKGQSTQKGDHQVFFAAVEGLKLYPEPQFSDNIITELPLNEKLLRYRIEKGFAYVKVQRTGQKGWVENARLKWRIEKQKAPADQPPPATGDVNQTAADAASPEEIDAAASPGASTPSDSTTKKPDASVLDSY